MGVSQKNGIGSTSVRGFGPGSYCTVFDPFSMEFLFILNVLSMCFSCNSPCNRLISRGLKSINAIKIKSFCRVESDPETLKHIGDAILRILQHPMSTKDFCSPFAWFFDMIFVHPMPAPGM